MGQKEKKFASWIYRPGATSTLVSFRVVLRAITSTITTWRDTKPYDKFLSHEGVVARTIMLDRQMKKIIRKAPDTVVVNIGAGFDNRFPRVDNGKIWWFDLDLPDAIEARKKVFHEQDRVTMIAEQNNKLMQKNEKHHDTVKSTNARFLSGTDTAQEIADLTDGIRLIEEHSFNEEMKKYSIRGKLFALLLPKMNDRSALMWSTGPPAGQCFCVLRRQSRIYKINLKSGLSDHYIFMSLW
ncbi:MAG: class I SAM-dependent methyltransferase [Eubacterium sp.]|nr:class I SAM-dependent methyltransferase [Eubacterium sp.]